MKCCIYYYCLIQGYIKSLWALVITFNFRRSKVKIPLDSRTSPPFNEPFLGPLLTFPENVIKIVITFPFILLTDTDKQTIGSSLHLNYIIFVLFFCPCHSTMWGFFECLSPIMETDMKIQAHATCFYLCLSFFLKSYIIGHIWVFPHL